MTTAYFLAIVLFLPGQEITQSSSGWCSPNIVTSGDVTVTCIGVDPRALKRLNDKLRSTNLQLGEKIQEANNWAAKYHELEQRLAQSGDDSVLSRQAEEYIHQGEFEKAGAILDEILKKEETEIDRFADRIAANHYNRGLVFALQFQPLQALPHYEKACQYRPGNAAYALAYGTLLGKQKTYTKAEPILLSALQIMRNSAKSDGDPDQSNISLALNNLAVLYGDTQRFNEAESSALEALQIRRDLASTDPSRQYDVAVTLGNLATL
jgi:tetratricopeptide (TPR) repeat protein